MQCRARLQPARNDFFTFFSNEYFNAFIDKSSVIIKFLNPISGVITNQMIQVNDTLTVFVTVADGNNCQTTDSIVINTFQKSDLNIQVVDSICDSSFAYISQIQNNNQYCISRPFDSSFYNVSNVSLNGDNFSINNNTAFNNASYSNYTNLIADVTAGSSE